MTERILHSLYFLILYSICTTNTANCPDGCEDHRDCPKSAYCIAISDSSPCGRCLCRSRYRTTGAACVPNTNLIANDCSNGCQDQSECPQFSYCTAISNSAACGRCLCQTRYRASSGSQCVPSANAIHNAAHAKNTTKSQITSTQAVSPRTTPAPIKSDQSLNSTVDEGALNCADYTCPWPFLQPKNDTVTNCRQKLFISQEQCGTVSCYGYCLKADKNYCVCPHHRIDYQCATEKTGSCSSASGLTSLSGSSSTQQNSRFINPQDSERSILARHFAASLDDCVKLCQWADSKHCRAVNYGAIGGRKVCELLTYSPTARQMWLTQVSGWQHVEVVS